MQFIERLFCISPDAGSGFLEISLISIPVIVLGFREMLKRTTDKSKPHCSTAPAVSKGHSHQS
jgi:hypothetical protein